MDYEVAKRMAQQMKEKDWEIRVAIRETTLLKHGIVALKFDDQGSNMEIKILDEPFDPNVRVYIGKEDV